MMNSHNTQILNANLIRASASISQSIAGQRTPLPDRLFHYTNSAGMRGILESNRLWATNYRFLNDKSEIAHGVTILEQLVKDRLDKVDHAIIEELLSRLLRTANAFEGIFDCFVSCFCERNDLLNQWRDYAASGGGYAIGFNSREIGMRWGQLHPSQDLILTKVIYDPATQTALIAEVVDSAVRELKFILEEDSTVESANTLIASCCQFVRSNIADYLLSFKHPAFAAESEWRLCLTPRSIDEVQLRFRDGPYGLTPYVEIDPTPMAGVLTNKLPLASITHGPVPEPSNTRFALNALLHSNGYHFVAVDGCDLPVRLGS